MSIKKSGRKCAFCSKRADSNEHIYPQWMRDILGSGNYHIRRKLESGEIREWKTPVLEMKTKHYCQRCNNTWGSDLENAMKGACADLILRDTRRTLSAQDCLAMANFMFKTTVLANHMNMKTVMPFFSEQQRRAFATHRTLPSGIQVFTVQSGKKYISGMFRSMFGNTRNTKPQFHIQLYTCTFSIGRLALQLLAAKWTHMTTRHIFQPPPLSQPKELDDKIIRIYPNIRPVQWPPGIIDDEMSEWFWQRWGNDIGGIPSSWSE